MLPEVPAVNVPPEVNVNAPFKFNEPAPPLMSITLEAACVPLPEKVIPPLAFNVPVVITIFSVRVAVLFEAGKLIRPDTVAEPPLIFQAQVMPVAVGCAIVTAPLTVKLLVPLCVKLVAVAEAAKVKEAQLLSLANV